MRNRDILVSIVVMCYNAQDYIIETLESAKNQTYKNIELVITDDCSTDDTYLLCEKWIEKNKDRFVDVVLTTTEKNGGVVVNLNHGCKIAKGKWIKFVSGDDLLPYNAVEENLKYVCNHHIETICCSKSASFISKNGENVIVEIKPDYYTERVFNMDAKGQYKKMLLEYVILLPITCFVSKELYERMDYYDESFPEIEDQPFFLKLGRNGIKIHYNSKLVGYFHRTNINSVSQTTTGMMNVEAFRIGGKLHRQDKKFVLPYVPKYHIVFYYHFYLDLLRRRTIITTLKNRNTRFNHFVNKVFLILDPIAVKRKIYNVIMRIFDNKNR